MLTLTIDRSDPEDAIVTCVIDGKSIGDVFSLPATLTDTEIDATIRATLTARGYTP